MPDLLTHVSFAEIVRLVPAVDRLVRGSPAGRAGHADDPAMARARLTAYYAGASMPDLPTRPFHILWPWTGPWVEVLHSPCCLAIVAFLVLRLLEPRTRSAVTGPLAMGIAAHLSIDVFQRHLAGGYYLWYPFSLTRTTWGILWPEETLMVTPVIFVLALAAGWHLRRRDRAYESR